MARKYTEKPAKDIEEIVSKALIHVGIKDVDEPTVELFTRLVMSGIAEYFFHTPDVLIKMGYLQFKKNPNKDELFTVEILKNEKANIVNAESLWRFYKGDLLAEEHLKNAIDTFITELLCYSQQQEIKVSKLTKRLRKR